MEFTKDQILGFMRYARSDAQRALIEKWAELGTVNAAARELRRDSGTCYKSIKNIRRRAALKGYAPEAGRANHLLIDNESSATARH